MDSSGRRRGFWGDRVDCSRAVRAVHKIGPPCCAYAPLKEPPVYAPLEPVTPRLLAVSWAVGYTQLFRTLERAAWDPPFRSSNIVLI